MSPGGAPGWYAVLICYDRRFPECWRAARQGDADLVCVPVAGPADAPGDFAMNATFGFLVSPDSGGSWEWTCHEAVSVAVITPGAHRAPNGALYAILPLLLAKDPSITLWRPG